MSPDRILSLLDGVRSSGKHAWKARCPAHDDCSPSLSIALKDDGKLLVHCWAGCETETVLEAIGCRFTDLFPHQPDLPREVREEIRIRHEALKGFRIWRETKLVSLARELRTRDEAARRIANYVASDKITEEMAWTYLSVIYEGYASLEADFETLLRGSDSEALEVYRHG